MGSEPQLCVGLLNTWRQRCSLALDMADQLIGAFCSVYTSRFFFRIILSYRLVVCRWSLGALFYEMLTANPPFRANSAKELEKMIMYEKFMTPNFLTGNAQTLLRGMLDKDPNKRLGASKATMFQIGGVSLLKRRMTIIYVSIYNVFINLFLFIC